MIAPAPPGIPYVLEMCRRIRLSSAQGSSLASKARYIPHHSSATAQSEFHSPLCSTPFHKSHNNKGDSYTLLFTFHLDSQCIDRAQPSTPSLEPPGALPFECHYRSIFSPAWPQLLASLLYMLLYHHHSSCLVVQVLSPSPSTCCLPCRWHTARGQLRR